MQVKSALRPQRDPGALAAAWPPPDPSHTRPDTQTPLGKDKSPAGSAPVPSPLTWKPVHDGSS